MNTYVIAEIGPNHNGSIDVALDMVRQLADSGANAIKFQLAQPEAVYSADAFKAGYQKKNDGDGSVIEMSRRLQLSREAHKRIYDECISLGVSYMCTAFDIGSLEYLDTHFDLPAFKIASGELLSIDMLEYIALRKRPVIVSTGMATYEEIGKALIILTKHGLDDITLLHCVSNYPAPYADINLHVIPELSKRFGLKTGYSDHSLGYECCLAAVAMGAKVIEKHVTLNKDMPGPDHKASATIGEFKQLVKSIRSVETSLGMAQKMFSQEEIAIRKMARKSIVTTRKIPEGTILTIKDITYKRPGTGISPVDLDQVIGKRVLRQIDENRVIHTCDLTKV